MTASTQPPIVPRTITRGAAFRMSVGFVGRAPQIDTLTAEMLVKRNDSLTSAILITMPIVWSVPDAADPQQTLTGTFAATSTQTAGLPGGELYYTVDLLDELEGDRFRKLEGPLTVND